MKESQNFVKTFGMGKEAPFRGHSEIPCVILFYPFRGLQKVFVEYGHFDERNFSELRTFSKIAKENGSSKIAFFGGYGSKNSVLLLRFLKRNGLEPLVDRDFTSAPPVKKLYLDDKGVCFSGERGEIFYSMEKLYNVFHEPR